MDGLKPESQEQNEQFPSLFHLFFLRTSVGISCVIGLKYKTPKHFMLRGFVCGMPGRITGLL